MPLENVPFVTLRHNLAPPDGIGQVYMPTSILAAGARAISAGANITFQDGNLRHLDLGNAGTVGVAVLGAPYIPEVKRQIYGERSLILGGQVIKGLANNREHLERLFGHRAVHGNDDGELATALGVDVRALPSIEETSLIPAYEKLSPEDLRTYLSTEFSFFLGQGCNKSCSFCSADRTWKDPLTSEVHRVTEQYRKRNVVEKDLAWLTEKAKSFGLTKFDMYLSNLDLFQTPILLREFADTVLALKRKHPEFEYRMRGLSTTKSFVFCCNKLPDLVQAMVDAGLHTVGFGVDGDPEAEDVKASVHKKFNTVGNCEGAIRLAREHGITPETLMVFGHPKDTLRSLQGAVRFAARMMLEYGAVPRPHAAKTVIPGNDGWRKPRYAQLVEKLLSNPDLFFNLDFTCEPSTLTHSNPRRLVRDRKYFRIMARIAGSTTKPLFALEPDAPKSQQELAALVNRKQFDRSC